MISLESVFRLGWGYARILMRKLRPEREPLRRFARQYEADGVIAFEPSDELVVRASSACTMCKACDHVAILNDTWETLGPDGPMAFIVGVSRHSSHHDFAGLADRRDESALRQFEAACPVDVPFVALEALVRRRGERLREVRRAQTARTLGRSQSTAALVGGTEPKTQPPDP